MIDDSMHALPAQVYSTPERIRQIFPSSVPTLELARTLTRNPKALANRV